MAVDPAGNDGHYAAPRADVELRGLTQKEQPQARAGISVGSGSQVSENEMFPQWHLPGINMHPSTVLG
jgi:hypothetical protein